MATCALAMASRSCGVIVRTPLSENIAQRRLAPDPTPIRSLLVSSRNLPGDFEVEQAFLLDRIGRNDQRTDCHVRLPPRNQLDRLRLALRVDDAQAGIVAAKAFISIVPFGKATVSFDKPFGSPM